MWQSAVIVRLISSWPLLLCGSPHRAECSKIIVSDWICCFVVAHTLLTSAVPFDRSSPASRLYTRFFVKCAAAAAANRACCARIINPRDTPPRTRSTEVALALLNIDCNRALNIMAAPNTAGQMESQLAAPKYGTLIPNRIFVGGIRWVIAIYCHRGWWWWWREDDDDDLHLFMWGRRRKNSAK